LCFGQEKYAGIEIGSKGIKISILEIANVRRGSYKILDFWTENVGIVKNISIDGTLAIEDIDNASNVVTLNYAKLRSKFKIAPEKIFIVASSGVGMATNTAVLVSKIKTAINKDLDIISSKLEAKLLFKGCVPPKMFNSTVLIDIGGGNTKGGYTEVLNDNLVFFPINLNLGTITLTEKLNKKTKNSNLDQFLVANFSNQQELTTSIIEMMLQKPLVNKKDKILLTGGAIWAFYTLFHNTPTQNMNLIKLEDVREFNAQVQNNFSKFTRLATVNSDVAAVLKTYSQKNLIAANSLLLTTIENIEDVDNKNLYFAKNGYLAWLISYIYDAAKGVRMMY
jgi:exopolyphosphatase/pppGpp-phosphohydrolase